MCIFIITVFYRTEEALLLKVEGKESQSWRRRRNPESKAEQKGHLRLNSMLQQQNIDRSLVPTFFTETASFVEKHCHHRNRQGLKTLRKNYRVLTRRSRCFKYHVSQKSALFDTLKWKKKSGSITYNLCALYWYCFVLDTLMLLPNACVSNFKIST